MSLTFAEAKEALAGFLPEGAEAFRINTAQERLIARGKYRGMVKRIAIGLWEDGVMTLPAQFETLLGARRENIPEMVRDHWYEFAPGSGPCHGLRSHDLGDGFTTFRDPATDTGLLIVMGNLDAGKTMTVRYRAFPGGPIFSMTAVQPEEQQEMPEPGEDFTPYPVAEVVAVEKDRTQSRAALFSYQDGQWVMVGLYEPWERKANLRRYRMAGAKNGDAVLALCKRRFIKVEADEDELVVDQIYALRLALEALSYEEEGDVRQSVNYWRLAVQALDDALSEHRGSAARTVPTFVRAAAGSKFRAFR